MPGLGQGRDPLPGESCAPRPVGGPRQSSRLRGFERGDAASALTLDSDAFEVPVKSLSMETVALRVPGGTGSGGTPPPRCPGSAPGAAVSLPPSFPLTGRPPGPSQPDTRRPRDRAPRAADPASVTANFRPGAGLGARPRRTVGTRDAAPGARAVTWTCSVPTLNLAGIPAVGQGHLPPAVRFGAVCKGRELCLRPAWGGRAGGEGSNVPFNVTTVRV